MSSAPVLRAARAADLAELLEIENSAFMTERISRRAFRRFLVASAPAFIVAEESGHVCGYALTTFRAGSSLARLYSLAVARGSAGRGLGTRLLAAAEDAARARGRSRLCLEVSERNRRAAALYRRQGYAEIGRREGYYGDGSAALRMEKRLHAK